MSGYQELTLENIKKVEEEVLKSSYGSDLKILKTIFNKYPKNTNIEEIAIKIALVDVTNSTHLSQQRKNINIEELAHIIADIKNFDELVKDGNIDLVNRLAKSNGKVNLFSFATKYCKYHNTLIYGKDDYSVYDQRVKEALAYYYRGDVTKNKIETWRKTFNYEAFHNCIGDLLEKNNIKIENARSLIDHFLWYRGDDNKEEGNTNK